MIQTDFYKTCLRTDLSRRCEKNKAYSVRAYAKALRIDAGTVSRLLNGKQIPTLKMARRLLQHLDLSPEHEREFIESLVKSYQEKGLRRLAPILQQQRPEELSIEIYRMIANWYHVAILELTYVKGFRSDPKWIAKELEISLTEANLAVERLLKLELLIKTDSQLVKARDQLTSADKSITTPALKKHQRQFLEKALFSLDNDPISERSITSMTMAIDPEKLGVARDRIQEFNRSLCAELETGKRKRVYNLSVCLFPIQKGDVK